MNLQCGTKSRLLLAGLALLAVLWCCRKPILAGLAWPLVTDDPPENVDCVWIVGGADHAYDTAARLYQRQPSIRILLVEPEPSRLVRLGILPSFVDTCRRELASRSVPPNSVVVIASSSRRAWEGSRQLAAWLQRNPGTRALALVDRFRSAQQRQILDSVLGTEVAGRVCIAALPDRQYNESNWWQSRAGVRELMLAWLARAYVWWAGEGEEPPPSFEIGDFDRLVAERSAEVSR